MRIVKSQRAGYNLRVGWGGRLRWGGREGGNMGRSTNVAELRMSVNSGSRKSPLLISNSPYDFPYHSIHLINSLSIFYSKEIIILHLQ